jgi:hypothetical protein
LKARRRSVKRMKPGAISPVKKGSLRKTTEVREREMVNFVAIYPCGACLMAQKPGNPEPLCFCALHA